MQIRISHFENVLAADIADGAVGRIFHLEPAVHFGQYGQLLAEVAFGKDLRFHGRGPAKVHPAASSADGAGLDGVGRGLEFLHSIFLYRALWRRILLFAGLFSGPAIYNGRKTGGAAPGEKNRFRFRPGNSQGACLQNRWQAAGQIGPHR